MEAHSSPTWLARFRFVAWYCERQGTHTNWLGGCLCRKADDPDAADCTWKGRKVLLRTSGRWLTSWRSWMERRSGLKASSAPTTLWAACGQRCSFSIEKMRVLEPHTTARCSLGPAVRSRPTSPSVDRSSMAARDDVSGSLLSDSQTPSKPSRPEPPTKAPS